MTSPATSSENCASSLYRALVADLIGAASEPAREWLIQALASVSHGDAETPLERHYAAAARRMRDVPFRPSAATTDSAGLGLPWDAARATRTALLLAALENVRSDRRAELLDRLFRRGDNAERIALLGSLALLPTPEVYLATAVDACRSNVLGVFEAMACENDYPTAYFPDESFNQMVLKALFLGVSVARIRGLERRTNDELVRMAAGYGEERRAAGRTVPEDIARIVGPNDARAEER